MMAPRLTAGSRRVLPPRRKHPLPHPLGRRAGELAVDSVRQLHTPGPSRHIAVVRVTHPCQMTQERADQHLGEHRPPVTIALPTADDDFAASEIEVLHPQL